MHRRLHLLRDFHAGQYLDLFLLSAVAAVLGIRFFLELTGYPQVGGDALHIAHMLWGGVLMLASIVLLVSFLGRGPVLLAAVLGGAGFGTFIDEVGKFVTHDHDYFFRPAIALIYISFVLLYLAGRSLHRRQTATPDEYLANALQELENVAFHDLDRVERDRALYCLERSNHGDPVVRALTDLFRETALVPVPSPNVFARLRGLSVRLYWALARQPWFVTAVIAFFVGQLAFRVAQVVALSTPAHENGPLLALIAAAERGPDGYSFSEWAQILSSGASGVFVLFGVALIRTSRARAYRMFQRSLLISVLITQVFMFYEEQWAALIVLAWNLSILAALHFMLRHERDRSEVVD